METWPIHSPIEKDKWREHLAILDLTASDHLLCDQLQSCVIQPHLENITHQFYQTISSSASLKAILTHSGVDLEQLSATHQSYLSSLGVHFDSDHYLETRYKVGLAHAQVGLDLSLYECAYQALQQQLINHIPDSIRQRPQDWHALISFILKITSLDMSLAIDAYHNSKVNKLQRSLKSLRKMESGLRKQVETDDLTGSASHFYTLRVLEIRMRQARQQQAPLCIAMVDLDHFKEINDRHGHIIGDQVLQDVVGRMQSSVRDFDLVGRYGGEEFLIIFYDANATVSAEIAERLRRRVADTPVHVHDRELNITLSLGLAEYDHQETMQAFIARADQALYAAKHGGRNCIKQAPTGKEHSD